MKILKIRFKNIHSFKDEHSIDFEDPRLAQNGLFVIVGPTGSGKSSLLDVITLALFNQIPRIQSSISDTLIKTVGSIVTHHTEEAEAEVVYQCNGQKYQSSWWISKNRKGEFRPYDMAITNLTTGERMDLKKSQVPQENQQIIGLNYDQFVKSIILSQGKFAEFLVADRHRRGELLERITGSEIFRKLGKAAFDRKKAEEVQLKEIRDRIQMVPILPSEERSYLSEQKNLLESNIQSKNEELNLVQGQKVVLEQWTKLQMKKSEIQRQSDQLTLAQENFKNKEDRWLQHQKFSVFRTELALLDQEQKEKSSMEAQSDVLAKDLSIQISAFEKVKEEIYLVSSELKYQNSERIEPALRQLLDSVKSILQRKSMTQAEAKSLKDEITADIQKNRDIPILASFDPATKSDQAKSQIEAALALIKTKIPAQYVGIPSAELSQAKRHSEDQVQLFDQCLSWIKDFQAISKECLIQANDHQRWSNELSALLPELEQLQIQLDTKAKMVEDQEKLERMAQSVRSLAEHRTHLQVGEPCPLCGSKDHPLWEPHMEALLSEAEQNLKKLKQDWNALSLQLDEKKKQKVKTSTNIEMIQARMTEFQAKKDQLLASKPSLLEQVLDIENVDSTPWIQKRIEEQQRRIEIESVLIALAQIPILEILLEKYQKLFDLAILLRADDAQLKLLCDRPNPDLFLQGLLDRFSQGKIDLLRIQDKTDHHKKGLIDRMARVETLSQNLLNHLQTIDSSMDIAGLRACLLTDAEEATIRAEKSRIDEQSIKLATIQKDIAQEEEGLKSKGAELFDGQVVEKKWHQLKQELEAAQQEVGKIIERIRTDDENQQKIHRLQGELVIANRAFRKWDLLNHHIGDATGNNFANFAQEITLRHLLQMANARLEKLSDRYFLVKSAEHDDLKVVDRYQGNSTRSVKTLSGGETFLISLALALALSDLASRNVRLDCLFIDEGFGTLDQETLETAVQTLERLQYESSKMVGIISHVESLKERIFAKITLRKDHAGFSKVEISG